MGLDAMRAQCIDQRLAPARVGALRLRELFLNARGSPQLNDEPLQDVADPADAEGLTPLDARDRLRVAGHDGQAKIGSE